MDFTEIKAKLESNRFEVSVFETKEEARDYLNGKIDGLTVGLGGCKTAKDMGLIDALKSHNTMYYSGRDDLPRAEMLRLAMTTDVYILSADGITLDNGELVNIDGTGNRVSSSLFGHKKVYFLAGKNKLAPNLETAIYNIKNVNAPKNGMRLHTKTPCAINGDRCYECNSPDRMCNALVVHYKKVRSMDMEVVLINEDLGY